MDGLRWVQLPKHERDELLDTGGIGVLSFATDSGSPPTSLPVSYGYLADTETLYFRLSFLPESNKADCIDNPVSFVSFEQTADGWQSVIATGQLEELTSMPPDAAAVQGLWGVTIPTVDIFDRPREEIQFRDFRLEPETLTGRKEASG